MLGIHAVDRYKQGALQRAAGDVAYVDGAEKLVTIIALDTSTSWHVVTVALAASCCFVHVVTVQCWVHGCHVVLPRNK